MMRRLSTIWIALVLVMGMVMALQAQGDDAAFAQQVLVLTNEARAAEGLPPLTFNETLNQVAQAYAQNMAVNDFMAHDDPNSGLSASDRVTNAGYTWQSVRENLAAGSATPEEVVAGWLNSPGHRENILADDVTEIGIGYYYEADDAFPDANTPYRHYWVQVFAHLQGVDLPSPVVAVTTPAGSSTPPVIASNGLITMTIIASPETVLVGEPITVMAQLVGQSAACPQQTTTRPIDVMLAIDNSDSMEGEPLAQAKQAAQAFLNGIDFNYARVGVVEFDSDAEMIHPLDTNAGAVSTAIANIQVGGGTSIDGALRVSAEYLQNNHRSEAVGFIVLVSDGGSDLDPAVQMAQVAARAGINIITVGLGDGVDEDLLRQIAAVDDDGQPRYYFSPDPASLQGIYGEIAQDVTESVLASNFQLTYGLDTVNFGFVPGTAVPAGSITGDQIIWTQPYLEDGVNTFTFQVTPQNGGEFDFSNLIEASYLECEQNDRLIRISDGPRITVNALESVATPTTVITETVPVTTPVSSQLVTMSITAEPQEVGIGEAVTIRITLSGDSDLCGQSVVEKPVDVILVLDHSGSMEGTPLEQAKQAAIAFVNEMDFASDRVGIVQFSSGASVVQSLSADKTAITQAIENIGIGGGTAIHEGLEVAFNEVNGQLREEATPVIVLLSDGESDRNAAEHAANAAKAANIKIITVALGTGLDEQLMRDIASTDSDGNLLYYNSPTGSDLESIYISIAQSIREYGLASDLTLRQELGFYQFAVFPESINEGGTTTGDTVTWEKELLEDGDTVFTYQVRPREGGTFDITQLTEALFLECEQRPTLIEVGPGPQVIVRGEVSAIPPVPYEVCEWWQTFPWWVLLPLLLLILLLLSLLFPWGRRFWQKLWQRPLLCKILAALLILYLLLLAMLLAHALQGDLCAAEGVYFWRAAADKNSAAIYMTGLGDEAAEAVQHLNQGSDCVACHASGTSQEAKAQYVTAVRDNQNGPVVAHTVPGRDVGIPLVNGSYTTFSPDGNYMAVSVEDQDIFVMEVETGILVPLAGASEPDIIETMPSWSPDGTTIAFARTTSTDTLNSAQINAPSDIYTVPANGGTPLPLAGASGDGFNYYPAYSPDGRWLAFTRHVTGDRSYADDAADIYLVPANGGEPIFLRANSDMADSWPSWSPDSRWLGFGSNRFNDQFDILLVQINEVGQSSGVYQIPAAATTEGDEFFPVWVTPLQLSVWDRLLALWPWLIPLPILLLLAWLFCRERQYELSGQVTDALSRERIAGAQLKIVPHNLPDQYTDSNGRYAFRLSKGDVNVTATAPEYAGQTRSIAIIGDAKLDFSLYPHVAPRETLKPPPLLSAWEQPPVWQPIPTLVIGLGGTGRHVLTYLKKNLLDAGAGQIDPRVRLLLLDTSDYELLNGEQVPITFAGVQLEPHEVVEFGEDLSELLHQTTADVREIQDWFPTSEYRTRLGQAEWDLRLGTRGRRPLARATLVRDVRQGSASRLWQRLQQEAAQALDPDDKRLRVMIAGSLAGGFGSATIADVAYLARRVAETVGARATSVESYLATDGAFNRVATRLDVNSANTYASLRELERLQLAQGHPLRMTYNRAATDNPILTGVIDWRLLDEVYLFDRPPDVAPANKQQIKGYNNPRFGIFPAMADAITLWLDKASRTGALGIYRTSVQSGVTAEQKAQGRAVVGGLGVFTYRLPMYDLVMQLQARWVRALLRRLVLGDAEGELRLDPQLNKEQDTRAVHDHVHHFLVGLTGINESACPALTVLVGILANEGNSANFREKLAQYDGKTAVQAAQQFQVYLAGGLAAILNGNSASSATAARGGKLGYALDFLNALQEAFKRAKEEMELLPSDQRNQAQQNMPHIREILPQMQQIVERYAQNVQTQAGLISQRLRHRDSELSGAGLYEKCVELEKSFAANISEMDAVLVRHYVHSAELLKQWQQKYLFNTKQQDEALQRLHWQVLPEGTLALTLQVWANQGAALQLTEGETPQFLPALFQLAAYVTQGIWQQETLAQVLAQTALARDAVPQTVQTLYANSTPLLAHDVFQAPNSMWHVALGVNKTVEQAGMIEKLLKDQVSGERQLTRQLITDPFAMLVTQTVDVLPLQAIQSLTAAERVYRTWYGLLPNVPADQRAEPTAVLRAERIALTLEQRLQPELRQATRLLRPIIVTALDSGNNARLYALAVAADWATYTREAVTLNLPQGAKIVVEISVDEPAHPLVQGVVRFAAYASEGDLVALGTAVAQANEAIVELWRRWTHSDWQTLALSQELHSSGPDGVDLATVMALVSREEVRRRYSGNR